MFVRPFQRRRPARRLIPVVAVVLALAALSGLPMARGQSFIRAADAAAAAACGDDFYPQGVDVSTHQGAIDWKAVAAAGIDFGMARIADGLTFPDATFQTNYAGMRANGITPGSYLFFEPGQDAVAQANAVVAALTKAGFRIGDLPPAIDVEVTGNQSPAVIASGVRTMASTIQATLGVTPFIYASPGAWNRIVASAEFGDLPLWVAHWLAVCPAMPNGWDEWSLWQFSSTGRVPGIAKVVDLDFAATPTLPVYTGRPVFPSLRDMTAYALGPDKVTYSVRAVGPRGVPVASACSPASGSVFPLGPTNITCTATNSSGTSTQTVRLAVRFARPPAFDEAVPADVAVLAGAPAGTPVAFGPVTAIDYAGGRIPATCSPASGAAFLPGRTVVTCTATDSFGQAAQRSFAVSVSYRFTGLLAPITDPITATSPVSVFPSGAPIPVRFVLSQADGLPINDAAASAVAAACGALVWLVPLDRQALPDGGYSVVSSRSLVCARYDATAHQLAADLPTAGAPPGDYTVVVAVADREGTPLAGHVAEIRLR